MKFIKENSYDIVKFFIYQLGIAIFSLTLAIPLQAAVEDDKTAGIVQLCVFLILKWNLSGNYESLLHFLLSDMEKC